eukprot:jgi/Chrzof1/7683/Cz02g32240.t1
MLPLADWQPPCSPLQPLSASTPHSLHLVVRSASLKAGTRTASSVPNGQSQAQPASPNAVNSSAAGFAPSSSSAAGPSRPHQQPCPSPFGTTSVQNVAPAATASTSQGSEHQV